MKYLKFINIQGFLALVLSAFIFQSCSSFNYKTYDEKSNENIDDPDPNYNLTLDQNFQDFTSFMFIGNRIENFSTYFNTYFNARENFDAAYEDYATKVLANYSTNPEIIFSKPVISQEATDKFNKAIEKASKVIQFHKSSQFMDRSVLLIGKSYYYLGDYLKAERKFGEFLSKLSGSPIVDEARLYLAKTQLRLDNYKPATETLLELIKKSQNKTVVAESYQSMAEYYLSINDKENAIKNFKKAIELSGESDFKAQMQFLVATVTSTYNPKSAAVEFDKVLDYNASFELEYLSKLNYAKSLVAKGDFVKSQNAVEDLEVKYKDNNEYLGQISYVKGTHYEQQKDFKRALAQYYEVIKGFPSTVPSSDASFRLGAYYESQNDYINAFRYYRFSSEQSSAGTNRVEALSKITNFKRYFELRSTITGTQINTDYDNEFRKKTSTQPGDDNPIKPTGDEEGKGGSFPFNGSLDDSVFVDSTMIKAEAVAGAKFELAELFLYNLNKPDSCEIYLKEAYNESGNYDFKAKVLFALSAYYRTLDYNEKSDEILRQIVNEYPLSPVANSSRRLLNIAVNDAASEDAADSLYFYSESKFINKNYTEALDGFKQLIILHPNSSHIDRAMYGSGWIYENVLMKPDSAYFYYSSLVKSSPNSEAAAYVIAKVTEYETFNNTGKDSSSIIDTSGVNTDTSSINKDIDPELLKKELEKTDEELKLETPPVEKPVEKDPMKKEDEIKTDDTDGDGS